MPNGNLLELSSLVTRHSAIGDALLRQYAAPVIVRLCIDPTRQPSGTMRRGVEIDWRKRPGKEAPTQVRREISWAGIQDLEQVCEQLPYTKNAHDLTEEAAVGVAALLINDLEEAVLQSVLPIGSGGDYLVRVQELSSPIQLEVSGLRDDQAESASRARLREKTGQVLKHARVGFVSVTTFSHGAKGAVHSYLHYVRSQKPSGKSGKKK
jgi:hypothetical protein